MSGPHLPADTPEEWLTTHLEARQRVHVEAGYDEAGRTWLSLEDLLTDDAVLLRQVHARMVAEDGAPDAVAAKWVSGWYAGQVAHAVGFVYAFASAAVLVRPELVRFGLHPEGWTQLVDLGAGEAALEVAVVEGHPWQHLPGVRTVTDDVALAALAVSTLTRAVLPVLAASRTLGKVGLAALWAEIADDFALTALYQLAVPGDPVVAARVRAALRTPAAPWRKLPVLRVVDHHGVPTFVGRKGGCCLAYRCVPAEAEGGVEKPDERTRTWQERFPPEPPAQSYCGTCSLRDRADCEERQLFWLDQERAVRTGRTA